MRNAADLSGSYRNQLELGEKDAGPYPPTSRPTAGGPHAPRLPPLRIKTARSGVGVPDRALKRGNCERVGGLPQLRLCDKPLARRPGHRKEGCARHRSERRHRQTRQHRGQPQRKRASQPSRRRRPAGAAPHLSTGPRTSRRRRCYSSPRRWRLRSATPPATKPAAATAMPPATMGR